MNPLHSSFLLAVAALLCASQPEAAAAPSSGPAAIPTVRVAPATKVKESTPKRYVGLVESIEHVDLMPRVTGEIREICFKEGEFVKKGDLLYIIEDTTYRAAVETLQAEKEALEATLHYAQSEFKRNKRLVESKAVSVSVYDKAVLEINSARARIKGIEASLTDARNNLSYTRIHAPISGRIGISLFSCGNLVTPQSPKLTNLEQIAPIYVKFSLSERIFRRDFGGLETIKDRAVVRVLLADNTLHTEEAKIALIDNKVDTSSDTVTVWAAFPNQNQQLMPGGFVTVLLAAKTDRESAAILPSALLVRADGEYVFVLDQTNKIEIRKVRVLGNSGKFLIVSGLDGTETTVVDGTHKIQQGMIVKPVPAAALPAGNK
ncbi:MAG: efflux RND transporter periplasmic adaptor subunit [Victivallaceae bacterium]|nr:efflux RND transporter periplasmic adaptor subunit [Victivallaceae bacterium]